MRTNVIPNIVSITANKGEATRNLYMLFAHDPSLFGPKAQCLMYVLHAGSSIKVSAIRGMLVNIITNRTIKSDNTNQYVNDGSLLAIWARLLKDYNETISFEPVFKLLDNAYNKYLKNKTVEYDDKTYNLEFFKPICYDRNGYNYYELIPRLAYLATFFIHGVPYTFAESMNNSAETTFENELEKYYTNMFAALKRDHNIDLLTNDIIAFSSTNRESLRNMLNVILDPTKIIQIRDSVLQIDKNVYMEAVESQEKLKQADIDIAFQATINMIIGLIINYNPMKDCISKMPALGSVVDSLELANLTEYALAGGYEQFLINDLDNYSYEFAFCEQPSFSFFGKQIVSTDINSLNASVKMPFTSADPYLKIVASYVKNKFDTIHDDPLGANDFININVSDIDLRVDNERYASLLINLIAQGTWLSYADSLHGIMQITNLTPHIDLIKKLSKVINDIYENPVASIIIPAYIITRIPHYLLIHINANQPLTTFNIHEYLYAYEMSPTLIAKLYNTMMALMYLNNDTYCKFVNIVSKEITNVMEKSTILIPMANGQNDCAIAYAIGGIDLYKYSVAQNPLIRAYAIVRNVMGTCERLNYYASVVSSFTNNSAFEIIENGILNPVLKISLDKAASRKHVLMDYEYKNGGYFNRNTTDIMNMKVCDEKITDILSKYMYKGSSAKATTNIEILTRRLIVSNGNVSIDKISRDDVVFGSETTAQVPVYDMTGGIKTFQFSFAEHLRHKILVQIELFSPTTERNMMAWVFSNYEMPDRFTIKTEMEFKTN